MDSCTVVSELIRPRDTSDEHTKVMIFDHMILNHFVCEGGNDKSA